MTFATQTTSNSRRISQNPSPIDLNRAWHSKCLTRRCPSTSHDEMTTFHFHEKSFASCDEFVDSKRFSRLLRTDLPLRSCLYDTITRDIAVQSFRTVLNDDLLPNDERWTALVFIVFGYATGGRGTGEGRGSRASRDSGVRFQTLISKTIRARPIIMVR